MPADSLVLLTFRSGLFAFLAIVVPGIAVQRLLRLRADLSLVLPLGLACCALAYWLGLIAGLPWLPPVIVVALDATLVRNGLRWSDGPTLRGALPALLCVALLLAASVWRQDRLDETGAFLAGGAQADDAAFHVGLTYELAQGYPPEVPGLAGFPLSYHLGASLVRAAALRHAGIPPYDMLSRFDNTLGAIALILALRGAAALLGASPFGVSLAGFSVLATDLSFLAAPGKGIEWWVGVFEGGTGLQSLFHANALVPALALALGSLIALSRFGAGEGLGWLVLAAGAALACSCFKVFLGAQLLGALAVAVVLRPRRGPTALVALGAGAALLPLVLGPAGATMQVVVAPLQVLNDARADLGLAPLSGPSLLFWLLPWLIASLGLRVVGLGRSLRELVAGSPAASGLAALALSGWPLGLLVRVSPIEPGLRERPFNEALYFFEQSGFVLWLFVAVILGGLSAAGLRRRVLAATVALTLPSTLQYVWQERHTEPRRLSPAIVQAARALEAATRPGDVVLVKPERQRYPPPPLLVGRRVPFTRFIPFFAQLAPRQALLERYQRVARFFETSDASEARQIARELRATTVCLFGVDDVRFDKEQALESLYGADGARVYRVR